MQASCHAEGRGSGRGRRTSRGMVVRITVAHGVLSAANRHTCHHHPNQPTGMQASSQARFHSLPAAASAGVRGGPSHRCIAHHIISRQPRPAPAGIRGAVAALSAVALGALPQPLPAIRGEPCPRGEIRGPRRQDIINCVAANNSPGLQPHQRLRHRSRLHSTCECPLPTLTDLWCGVRSATHTSKCDERLWGARAGLRATRYYVGGASPPSFELSRY